MNTAFDQAYEVYVARKQAERQAHLLQLRQELIASRLPSPLGRAVGAAANRSVAEGMRQRPAAR